MKLKLFLHVGMHKTGTTMIQSFLALNAEHLKRCGVYFPRKYCIVENKAFYLRSLIELNKKEEYNAILEDIICMAQKENCNSIILSDEDFQNFAYFNNNNIKILENYFDVKIIMYIRRQDKYSESAYGFWVQWYDKRTTVQSNNLLNLFPVINYNYMLKKWEDLFGFENIILRVYDNILLESNLLDDFLECINVKKLNSYIIPNRDESNVTLNKYIIEFLRRTNHIPLIQQEFDELKEFLLEESSIKIGPKANFLNELQRKMIFLETEESNSKVAKRYFQNTYLFKDTSCPLEENNLTDEMFWKVYQEIQRKPNLCDCITKETINLNIEKMRDILVLERQKINFSTLIRT